MNFEDLGIIDYKKAWDYQLEIFNKTLKQKFDSEKTSNIVLFCEHPHVITLGRNAQANNLLFSENFLHQQNVSLYNIDRGGDITYHGYGQQVVYPILDLESLGIGIKQYVYNLEEVVIQLADQYGIHAQRLDGAPGVWIVPENQESGQVRKLCAIGIRSSRFVTMHGIALNVNTDLSYFSLINPCGFTDKGVTSFEKELGQKIDMEEVKKRFSNLFVKIFLNKNIT